MLRHSFRTALLSLMLAVGIPGALAASALADTPGGSAGMPTQASVDQSSTDPGSFGAGWGDMAGGVSARPYVVSLNVINGSVSTPVITNGTTADAPVGVGGITAVVSPSNLCRSGQAPSPGLCYATPNRVGLTVGYGNRDSVGWDFSNPSVPVTPRVDANSVIDMTVALNTLGKSLRWTWVNGSLLYWQTHNLGQADATVHIKFRSATAPYVATFPAGNGCTATPPINCGIPRADGQVLSAQVEFSLDDTLDPSLTGAVFATQNALSGYLTPSGTPQAPSLDVELASTHEQANGAPQLGMLQAFIPSAALLNLYGVLPSDSATAFAMTRRGDPGSNDPPSFTRWSAAADGSDGLLITVRGVTFSAPRYHIVRRVKPLSVEAHAHRAETTITARVAGCKARTACVATVWDIGPRSGPRFAAHATKVTTRKFVTRAISVIVVPASKLRKGDRFLLVVRDAKHNKLLATSLGTVN